jgi:hypothetical protein
MKIELYQLQKREDFDLLGRIKQIMSKTIKQRTRERGTGRIRLEQYEVVGDQFVFMDFIRLRVDHGPAKAGEDTPAIGFELGPLDGFGEETAMVWDLKNNYCCIQYNHFGVRAKSISEYLSLFFHERPENILLIPKIDSRVHAKLRSKRLVKKISVSIAAKELSEADFNEGMSLGGATRELAQTGADQVEITITARQKNHLDINLKKFVSWISSIGRESEKNVVQSAHVTASEGLDDRAEILDLLHHKVTLEFDLTPGKDKRYSVSDRYGALKWAHSQWKIHEISDI